MDPITAGITSNLITHAVGRVWNRVLSPIKILQPRPQEVLSEPKPLGSGVSYAVKGTLRRLPKGHAIWILAQQEGTGEIWPQGFFPVQYDPEQGRWYGRVNGHGFPNLRILAVVAPPTSVDYFNYFQKLGGLRNYDFVPLPRLPQECTNVASMQAVAPE